MRGLVDWLDQRTGIRGLLHEALDEPIPGGARLAYVFGSGLLCLFLSQVITGVFLALYYVPSADHAHTTVAYIVKEVSSGSFVRGLHVYGSSAMVVLLLLHIGQTILWGSYKGARELLWLAGCGLFALVLGMAFTGYLLPWDQKAYFATAVGTNILAEVPLIGSWLQRFVRGGSDLGTLTISRFFVAHVFLLPAAISALVGLHVYLFRRSGAAGPATEVPPTTAESFYPRQVLMDTAFAILLIGVLGAASWALPADLGPEANAADTRFVPRPEWYYVPVFQWLKYWPGGRALIGIVIIPTSVAVLFCGLPFFDRRSERRPWRRPVSVGGFAIVLLGLLALGVASRREDARDPAVARQLVVQADAVGAFMVLPFEPEESAGSLKVARAALDSPQLARGKSLYEAQACDACHGTDGRGTDVAPSLVGVASKYPNGELTRVLKMPSAKMSEGGMQPLDLADPDVAALVAYLEGVQ